MSVPPSDDGLADPASAGEWGVLTGDPGWRHLDLDGDDGGRDEAELREIEDAHQWPSDVRYYAESSFTLPGMGDQPESCGSIYPQDVCRSCGSLNYRESTCESRSCPNCWRAWSRRRGEKVARRLGAARMAEDDGIRRRAVHAVVSPPPGSIQTIQDVQEMRREAYERAQRAGVRGGLAIVHGWRVKDEYKRLFSALKEEEDLSSGIWKWVRENEKEWREQVEWSPHVHIIGLSVDFEADTGGEWRVRRLSTLDPMRSAHDEDAYDSMVGAAMYVLSHAAIQVGEDASTMQTPTWFGELAYNRFSPEEAVSSGMLDTIERYAREAASPGDGDEDGEFIEEDEDDLDGECVAGTEGCGGRWGDLVSIWSAPELLRDEEWCDRVGDERVDRIEVAFSWMIGELEPPSGMRYPGSEEQAREALESML